MKKNIIKVIIVFIVIVIGFLIYLNDVKVFFSYEWKGLEIVKKLVDDEKKDEECVDRLIKDVEKERIYIGKMVEDLYVIVKKLGKGNIIVVVRIIDGGKNGYYMFDIMCLLEEYRKNIKVVVKGEIDLIIWY